MSFVPGALLKPGAHWNGEAGWVELMAMLRWHYTVGIDSTAIGEAGYFGLRIAQDGSFDQYSPDEAIDWDACETNPYGKGVEVESLDGTILQAQITTLGYITVYFQAMHGIAPGFYDGSRLDVGFWSWFRGTINHRAFHEQACAEHYDGFDTSIYQQAVSGSPSPQEDHMLGIMFVTPTGIALICPPFVVAVGGDEIGTVNQWASAGLLQRRDGSDAELAAWAALNKRLVSSFPSGGASGPTTINGPSVKEILDGMAARLSG